MSFSLIAMRLSSVSVTEEWGLTVDMPKSIASFDMVYIRVGKHDRPTDPFDMVRLFVYAYREAGETKKNISKFSFL